MRTIPRYPHAFFRSAAVLAAALLLTPALQATPAQAGSRAVTIYVTPSGSGKQFGTRSHPFRSLEAARLAVRAVNLTARADINVVLANGTHRIDKTFALTSRDSGRNGHKVTYRAAPGATPVISGGRDVTGWTVADAGRGIYQAHVGAVDTRQLYVNGELQTRARGADNPGGFAKTATGYRITDGSLAAYRNQKNIEVVSRWGWMMYRCPVDSITTTTMTMNAQCWHNANLHEGQEIQTPTWLENAYELLDSPGEWYLDKSTGDLYYKPKPGQDLATATVTIPMVQDLLNLNGTLGNPVQNVSVQGITFSYSTWLAPSSPDGMVEGQAGFRIVGNNNPTFDSTRLSWQKTPGAVNVSYGRNISFTGNRFEHLGAVGLNLNTGSQGTSIVGNVFTDVAATGIQVGGVEAIDHHPSDPRSSTKNTLVSNNVVTKVANLYNGSLGILAGYTDHTTIEHNKVYDLPYSGISVGWGWGLTDQGGNTNYLPGNAGVPIYPTPTTSTDTVVRNNLISDIMKNQADGGAIYTLSVSPHSVVSGNLIMNLPSPAYGAIYHDEGSRYWRTTQNAFCTVASQWLLLNHGLDIVADRNFTTNPQYSAQGNSIDATVANNPTVGGCAELPASLVRNAGLQPAYQHLDPNPPTGDSKAPSAPGRPAAAANFPTIADLSWAAASDNTAVTGYSVFANGTLVSAGKDPKARVTGLVAGTTYAFTVTARDAAGNESKASPSTTVTVPVVTDLARGRPATASSSYSDSYAPGMAVDGDLSTRWAQGSGLPDPSWLQVDLGARYAISGVITTFEKASGYRYRLESSNDNTRWTMIEDHTAQATTAAATYSTAIVGVVGRYVRLTITGSNLSGGSIYGLEVYGKPAATTPDTTAPTTPGKPTVNVLLPSIVDVSWPAATDNVGVTEYTLFDGAAQVARTTGAQLRLTGLTPGSAHSYTVVAQDAEFNQSTAGPATSLTLPPDHNLAQRKSVTASSYSESNTPQLAVDGNLTTRWAQGLGLPDPSWIQVDLGAVTSVKGAVTTFELPSGYQYRLEYSTDATTWSTLEDHTGTRTTERTNYSLLAQAVNARFVRLTVTGSTFNGGSIYELQVYGGF